MKIRTLKAIDNTTLHDATKGVTLAGTRMPAGRYTVTTTAGGFVWCAHGNESARYLIRVELFQAGIKAALIRVKEEAGNLF